MIRSPEFVDRHRTTKTAFTRNRTLTLPSLIMHSLNLIKGSAQQELDNTLQLLHPANDAGRKVTQSAYTQARAKFSHTAFVEINRQVIAQYYQQSGYKTWQGFRLCAVDGSQLRLPNETSVIEEFGTCSGRFSQREVPMAMTSIYYDVLNQMVIDAEIRPSNTPERDCVEKHLQQAQANDLVLFDRGYPAFWLYALFAQKNIAFCMRAKTRQDLLVQAFLRGNEKQAIVEFSPARHARQVCLEKDLPTHSIRLRLIRVKLKTETEVLITNLLDEVTYPAEWFGELYHQRWLIEELYKRQKQWLEVENFSGKSVESVRQDFHAKQVTHNLTSMMVNAAQLEVDQRCVARRLSYKVNFSQALSRMKNEVISLFLNNGLVQRIQKLVWEFSLNIDAVRPNRQFERRINKVHRNLFFSAYKACR